MPPTHDPERDVPLSAYASSGASSATMTTLAAVIDRVAVSRSRRDREFVRDFATWLDAQGERVGLPIVEQLGLEDVLLTFHMRKTVRLVITGTLRAHPGEVTVAIDERDFSQVPIALYASLAPRTYGVCTLDYGRAGAQVVTLRPILTDGATIPAGATGSCVVESTHGQEPFVRVRFSTPEVVAAVAPNDVRFLELRT